MCRLVDFHVPQCVHPHDHVHVLCHLSSRHFISCEAPHYTDAGVQPWMPMLTVHPCGNHAYLRQLRTAATGARAQLKCGARIHNGIRRRRRGRRRTLPVQVLAHDHTPGPAHTSMHARFVPLARHSRCPPAWWQITQFLAGFAVVWPYKNIPCFRASQGMMFSWVFNYLYVGGVVSCSPTARSSCCCPVSLSTRIIRCSACIISIG